MNRWKRYNVGWWLIAAFLALVALGVVVELFIAPGTLFEALYDLFLEDI